MRYSEILRAVVATTIFAAAMHAQPSNGYLFIAPGGYTCCHNTSTTLAIGGGGEYVFGKGIGAGAELGTVAQPRYFGDSMLGVLSVNGYYHFKRGDTGRVDPFVTGGYTLMFRSGHANLGNVGGGFNYWFHRVMAFRVEFRDHITTAGTTQHFWGFRFGLAFR